MIDYGKKLTANDPIFGQWNVTLGARIYKSNTDTKPTAIPDQEYQVQFGQPQTDLAVLNEEQVPENNSEEIVVLEEFNMFDNSAIDAGYTGQGFQTVFGGWKVYDTAAAAGACDRWYWRFELEIPTAATATDGTIYYQYMTYTTTDPSLTGAVACKTEQGNFAKSSADQWAGVAVNLDSSSSGVVGKKWNKQARDTKMKEP